MILQQLFLDFEALLDERQPPPMYDEFSVRWVVDIDREGKFKSIVPLGEKFGTPYLIPYNYGRSSDIVANLLVDTADYSLGEIAAPEDKNAVKKHTDFKRLIHRCAEATQNSLVSAVETFLESGGVPLEEMPKDLKAKDRVAFTVEGDLPTNEDTVRQFWDELTTRECKNQEKRKGYCLISGEEGYVESVLPTEIRISRESAPIISVNEDSANSYGFSQALNGAVSRDAAERFTKALNVLMRDKSSRVRFNLSTRPGEIDELYYVFWSRGGLVSEVQPALEEPDTDLVQKLLNSPLTAEPVPGKLVDPDRFFAFALTGNKTRVVFRDWLTTTLPEVRSHLIQWFLAQKITAWDGGKTTYYSLWGLAASAHRRDGKGKLLDKVSPRFIVGLLRSALHGEPVPRDLLAKAIVRCKMEHRVPQARAALLKAALTLENEEAAKTMSSVDENNNTAPYVCGRLLAILDDMQYQAMGKVNSTLLDRFFSAASTTPRRILPKLVQKATDVYLPKLRRQKTGVYISLRREMTDLLSKLSADVRSPSSIPETFTLEEQASFMLGFYHQQAEKQARIRNHAAKSDSAKDATRKEID